MDGHLERACGLSLGWLVIIVVAAACGKPTDVRIAGSAVDSMNVVFLESNRNWDSLQDLTTLERMLGTVRPTQREYLGCLVGRVRGTRVIITGFEPARNMKRLQLAVTGSCDSISNVVGSWHTHPFHADASNRAVKSRTLSPQDLGTFEQSGDKVVIVVWDVDSLDVAVRRPDGIVYPATIERR